MTIDDDDEYFNFKFLKITNQNCSICICLLIQLVIASKPDCIKDKAKVEPCPQEGSTSAHQCYQTRDLDA